MADIVTHQRATLSLPVGHTHRLWVNKTAAVIAQTGTFC